MKEFKNKIAVITGAAKGIGRALAEKCAALNMRIVLADFNEEALAQTESELKKNGAEVLSVLTNVTDEEAVNTLADKTINHFGVPHLLFNNAGIGGYVGPIWELSTAKIQWVMDVNFKSVVHGIKAFVPAMIKANRPAHIINTSSMAGLYSFPYFSTYIISKHSVTSLSECLYHDLKVAAPDIEVSILCAGGIKTKILAGSQEYPDVYRDQGFLDNYSSEDARRIGNFAKMVSRGIAPDAAADMVFDAIEKKKFYILTHPELKATVQDRMERILAEEQPGKLDLDRVFL